MLVMNHKIIISDCLQYMKTMESSSIDIVCTSPPYNIGINYNSYKDEQPRISYLSWLKNIGVEIERLLKSDGSFFLNIGSTNTDPWLEMDVASIMRDIFVLQNKIMWIKSISIKGNTFGHFKPISSKRFLNNNYETLFHFTKNGNNIIDRLSVGVEFKDKTNIARRKHLQDKRCDGNVKFIPYKTVQTKGQKFNHPATYPVELPEYCIKLHGGNHGIVLDPFVGSGSTLVAAKNMGWSGIGIEIDETYANIAKQRLEEI